jgi:hypothetical protein
MDPTQEATAEHLNREILRFAEAAEKRAEDAEKRAKRAEATRDEYLEKLRARDSEWMRSKFFERLKVYRQRANTARNAKDKAELKIERQRVRLTALESKYLSIKATLKRGIKEHLDESYTVPPQWNRDEVIVGLREEIEELQNQATPALEALREIADENRERHWCTKCKSWVECSHSSGYDYHKGPEDNPCGGDLYDGDTIERYEEIARAAITKADL